MTVEIFTLILLLVVLVALIATTTKLHNMIQEAREVAGRQIAVSLRLESMVARMEDATQIVAKNLASSIDRADRADGAVPGASADAALRTGQ